MNINNVNNDNDNYEQSNNTDDQQISRMSTINQKSWFQIIWDFLFKPLASPIIETVNISLSDEEREKVANARIKKFTSKKLTNKKLTNNQINCSRSMTTKSEYLDKKYDQILSDWMN